MLVVCEGSFSCWGVAKPSVSDDFGLCYLKLRTRCRFSAGQLVSGLMDSRPQMPSVLSRTKGLLGQRK